MVHESDWATNKDYRGATTDTNTLYTTYTKSRENAIRTAGKNTFEDRRIRGVKALRFYHGTAISNYSRTKWSETRPPYLWAVCSCTAPAQFHECGIYSYKIAVAASRGLQTFANSVIIWVVAALGGIVCEHEYGYRAEYAIIDAIIRDERDDDNMLNQASEVWGVPIISQEVLKLLAKSERQIV